MKPQDDDDDLEEESTFMTKVRWARDQAVLRLTCMVEGHHTDPDEEDDYGQAPCLRCGLWVYLN